MIDKICYELNGNFEICVGINLTTMLVMWSLAWKSRRYNLLILPFSTHKQPFFVLSLSKGSGTGSDSSFVDSVSSDGDSAAYVGIVGSSESVSEIVRQR